MFPRNAAMDKRIFSAERLSSSFCIPEVNSDEQNCSENVFWFSSPVRFFTVIFNTAMWQCEYVKLDVGSL